MTKAYNLNRLYGPVLLKRGKALRSMEMVPLAAQPIFEGGGSSGSCRFIRQMTLYFPSFEVDL